MEGRGWLISCTWASCSRSSRSPLLQLKPWIGCKEESMTAIHVVCGAVALGLLIYLVVAMLKPEKF